MIELPPPASIPAAGGLFAPLSPLLSRIPWAPELAALERLNGEFERYTGSGQRLSFVAPRADGLTYEARIWASGEVATRPGNWHDFFNALVWLTFPAAKAALNARHVGAPPAPASRRSSARDALTHFDECGVVVVSCDPSLLDLLRGFQWSALFCERRLDLARCLRCFVFGHATYEQLLRPFRGLTAKAMLYEVSAAWLEQALGEQLADLDRRLASALTAGEPSLRAMHPLPLMGMPGVTPENEDPAYYEDTWQFRPGRRQPRV